MSEKERSLDEVEKVLSESIDILGDAVRKANEEGLYKEWAESIVQFSEPLFDAGFDPYDVVELFNNLDELFERSMEE